MEGRPLEEDLIERSRNGDTAAFELLVREHQGLALRVAHLVLRSHSEAEDVTQEAFVKAYRSMGRFRPGSPFRPWLLRIVRNEALNRSRGNIRRQQLALRAVNDRASNDWASGDAAPSPEAQFISDEDRIAVLSAIDDLPPAYRSVIQHRYLLELTEEETAAVLGIARGTVKSRTARGLGHLRQRLKGAGYV